MTKEEEAKVLDAITSDILSNLTLMGVIEAAKWFAFENAQVKLGELTVGQKQVILEEVQKVEEEKAKEKEPKPSSEPLPQS